MAPAAALAPKTPLEEMVGRIDAAVKAAEISDTVELNLLRLSICPVSDQSATAMLLEALSYFSATLSSPMCSRKRAALLRSLTRDAINMDFASVQVAHDNAGAIAATTDSAFTQGSAVTPSASKRVSFCASVSGRAAAGTSPSPPLASSTDELVELAKPLVSAALVEAYRNFLRNTVSADSAFVEDVLNASARLLFRLPLPAFDNVVAVAHDVIPRVLAMYSHAEMMCIRIFADRYPHPVRPAGEHQMYARAVLSVALYAPTSSLASDLISVVVEKLAIIDAMVPDVIWEAVSADISRETLQSGYPGDLAIADEDRKLVPEAEKMDMVLVEFCSFADALSVASERVSKRCLKAIIASVERFVLPTHRARHAPMILLYSACAVSRGAAWQVSERLRVSFFDPTIPNRLRVSYLQYSAAMVCRASVISAADAFTWLQRLATWLHSYIDDRQDDEWVAVDVDVHELFYAGIFALMSVVTTRLDVFGAHAESSLGCNDVANNLRFLRIMVSDLNPLLVMPEKLVAAFCKAVEDHGDMRFDEVLEENRRKVLPSRTRFGNKNRFSSFMPLEECVLPAMKAVVKPYYRTGSRARTRSSIGSLNSLGRLGVSLTPGSLKRRRPAEGNERSFKRARKR